MATLHERILVYILKKKRILVYRLSRHEKVLVVRITATCSFYEGNFNLSLNSLLIFLTGQCNINKHMSLNLNSYSLRPIKTIHLEIFIQDSSNINIPKYP
jgi:hypothetical protein